MARHSRPDPPATPTLPTLEPGVTLLETETHAIGPLDSLVLDHLLGHGGSAIWVDSGGHAATQQLARIAPSRRLLDRVQVARGFTPFQHYDLVDGLEAQVEPETTLVVVPWVDARYRDGALSRGEPKTMLQSVADRLAALADEAAVPVLVTRKQPDELTQPFDSLSTRSLTYEATAMGPRFVGEEFETLVYSTGNGGVQTTLAFWERVLRQRHELTDRTGTCSGVA